MKSSFLVSLILTVLMTTTVWAQSTTVAATTDKSSFDKFYERLKIAYFSAFSGSSVGHWDQRALDEKGTKDKGYVNNLFNQVSFNYNFGAKMNFVFNPRWTVNLASTSAHDELVNSVINIEDFLVGFQGVLYTTEDKKFAYWTRAAVRLPTSRTSRDRDITLQPDWMNILTYDFNPTWQLGSYLGLRQWVYEQRYTAFRYRLYMAPYIQYAVNPTTKLALWYENYTENRSNLKSQNGIDPNFKNYWEVIMFSVSKDITPTVNFMPFVNYHINAVRTPNAPLENLGTGFWFSYQIK